MNNYQLKDELSYLKELKQRVEISLAQAPEGTMRCEMVRGKYPQYYVVLKEEHDVYPRGRYLQKKDFQLAQKYSQKEYDKNLLPLIDQRIKEISMISKINDAQWNSEIDGVYYHLAEGKRRLVTPYKVPTDMYVQNWKENKSSMENSFPINNGFTTENGEVVRSKSEKMIADKLLLRGVPYKYEAKLELKSGHTIYPDFTLMNIRTGKLYYYEHFGMMDNPEYCKKAIEKMELYEDNGIFLGEVLFVTYESSMKPINLSSVDNVITRMLL